jgi:hypothetical protein
MNLLKKVGRKNIVYTIYIGLNQPTAHCHLSVKRVFDVFRFN